MKAFPEHPDFKKHEFFVYYSNQIHDYIKDIDPAFKLRRFNLRSIPQRIIFEQNRLKNEIIKDKIDVFHSVANILPLNIKDTGIKLVTTIHDLLFLNDPDRYPFVKVKYYKKFVSKTIKLSHEIIIDSIYTFNDFKKFFPDTLNKLTVVPLAPDPVFYSEKTPDYTGEKFILTVSALEPGKGFHFLLENLTEILKEKKLKLFIAGPEGWKNTDLIKNISQNFSDFIEILGFLPDQDLAMLYQTTSLFIYPSLEEGFGLPVIEAMASGAPVLLPNTEHYKKISGNNAFFFEPGNKKSFIDSVKSSLDNFSQKEPAQMFTKQYSWKEITSKVMEVYLK
ncbi:MAG: glycosyltransferase family 1 protein [bacterium]|nr:glycosyltransferase family 1 protein [bacterium]